MAPDEIRQVRPTWDFIPPEMRNLFGDAAGAVMMVGGFLVLIGVALAAIRLLAARSSGSYSMGDDAKTKILYAAAAAILLGGAPFITAFFMNLLS